MCHIQMQLSEPTLPSSTLIICTSHPWSSTQLCKHPHTMKKLTFSQAVADAGIPGQKGVSAVESQNQRVCQAEDGEGVRYTVIAGPWLYAADPLKVQAKKKNKKTQQNLLSVLNHLIEIRPILPNVKCGCQVWTLFLEQEVTNCNWKTIAHKYYAYTRVSSLSKDKWIQQVLWLSSPFGLFALTQFMALRSHDSWVCLSSPYIIF